MTATLSRRLLLGTGLATVALFAEATSMKRRGRAMVTPAVIRRLSPQVTALASATANPADISYYVPLAANKNLVIAVVLQGASSDPSGTTVTMSADGWVTTLTPTKVMDSGSQNAGVRYSRAELWSLLAPPTGTIAVRVTRAANIVSARISVDIVTLADCEQSAPFNTMAAGGYFSTAAAGPYSTTLGITGANETVVGVLWTEITGSTAPDISAVSAMDLTGTKATGVSAAYIINALFTQSESAATTSTLSFTSSNSGTLNTAARYGGMMAVAWRAVTTVTTAPVFYVDAASGSNLNNGLSSGSAFQTLSAIEALSPVPAGTTINLKKGQVHRRSTPTTAGYFAAGPAKMFTLASAGTVGSPVTIQGYGTGADPMIAGDIPGLSWSSATAIADGITAAAVALGAQKATPGTTTADLVRCCFPCIDDFMLQPAIWSLSTLADANGHPSSIYAWDDSQPGCDSFAFPLPADVQDVGSGPYPIAANAAYKVNASWTGTSSVGSGTWTVNFVYPAIGTHYGTFSPVGAFLAFRSQADQTPYYRISAYDQATGTVTVTFTGSSNDGPISPASSPGFLYWAIVGHPLDLALTGQFAWSVNNSPGAIGADTTVYAIFPSGTTKSLTRYLCGASLSGTYLNVQNVQFARNGAEVGNTAGYQLLGYQGTGHVFNNVTVRQKINLYRTNCVSDEASATGVTFTNTVFDEAKTEGGFRLNSTYSSTFTGAVGRNLGRSAKYEGGGGTDPSSNGNVWTGMDFGEHLAVHGNGCSEYQGAWNSNIDGFCCTGSTTPATSQIKGAVSPVGPNSLGVFSTTNPKTIIRRHFFLTGPRDIGTTVPGAYSGATAVDRNDGGEYGSHWDRCIMPLGGTGHAGLDMGYEGVSGKNNGAVIERCILFNLAVDVVNTSMAGVTVKDCLLMNDLSGNATLAKITSAGATVTNCVVDTTAYNGCPTVAWQQYYTANDARTGYENAQVGPASWNWTMPAYGSSFAMVTLGITTSALRNGFQAGKSVGTLIRMTPGASIAIGAGYNSASFLLDRGVIIAAVALATGTYTLPIVETNAAATNGPTKTTLITITVSA